MFSDPADVPTALLESLGGIVWEADADPFRFVYVSPQAERILGYPPSRWLLEADFLRAHTPETDFEQCLVMFGRAASRLSTEEWEHRAIAADLRSVVLRTTVAGVRMPAGGVRLRGFTVDVTSRHESAEQARQARHLEAIGQLAGGVAHDFNNLLTVMSGYAETLADALGPDDPNASDVVEIRRAADRAAALTHQLLAFSGRQILSPELMDANALVRGVAGRVAQLLGPGTGLRLDLAASLLPIVADRAQIEQVLLDLAAHGRESMPQGGILEIRTRVEEAAAGSHVVLTVADSGAGLPPQTRDRLFEPFFTTRRAGEGAGLGLATVHGTIRQSGGAVRVDSEEGRGTRFDIHLPLAAGSSGSMTPDDRSDVATILLVEDYDRVRDFARRALERLGYRVLAAGSGDEALAMCRAHQGRLDLLVTDVMMSNMSGLELAEQVIVLRPAIAILYMSGYAAGVLNDRRLERDGAGFIGKPFTSADLALKVRELLARPGARSGI